jgi:hypothetical protein
MANKKHEKRMAHSFRLFFLGRLLFIFALIIIVGLFLTQISTKRKPADTPTPISRAWMEYAEVIVKKTMPHPPEAARFYAFVSAVYADIILATHDSLQASEATRQIVNQIYPDEKMATDKLWYALTKKNTVQLDSHAQMILDAYKERELHDGQRETQWDGIIPEGQGIWIKTNKQPFSPTAGSWQRWIVPEDTDFAVPAPPEYNSKEDLEQLVIAKDAAMKRDAEWNKKIIFWQGIPGTESPAGIWQNVFYEQVKDARFSDEKYSHDQKLLAQTIADAFLECWKVKYIYWTARPDMRIPGLVTSMPDPAFPSYLSGHSTISAAAATVLGVLVPQKKVYWMTMAEEARDSRLYAGIHFEIDNTNGFALGKKIGTVVLAQLRLQP